MTPTRATKQLRYMRKLMGALRPIKVQRQDTSFKRFALQRVAENHLGSDLVELLDALAEISLKDVDDLIGFSNALLKMDVRTRGIVYEAEMQKAATALSVSGLVIPKRKVGEGFLIHSISRLWLQLVKRLTHDWTTAHQIPAYKWEELIAGAFDRAGFDEVILTPRSGDHGRDVIAIKRGIGTIKIIGSVKAYKPGHLVKHDEVRALLGVMAGEADTSKGILTTTSDFAPRIKSDPFIRPFLPTRLELVNGEQLQQWLTELAKK